MREIHDLDEIFEFCKALSSPLRINIVKLLMQHRQINMNQLAVWLNVTNGAITSHAKILSEAGIISIEHTPGKRGLQKNCCLKEHKYLINASSEYASSNMYELQLPVGSYSSHNVYPTCGLATKSYLIGEVDDPRYFDDPQRMEAAILWLSKGYITYRIPNYLKASLIPKELQITFEIASEAPGICEEWPSDIHFYINDVFLGKWTSPGDFGRRKGLYTPDWWFPNWNQYGLLKLFSINKEGVFIDGRKISDIKIHNLNLDHKSEIIFKLAVPDSAENTGGLTLFGKGFGNYNQDINVRVVY